MSDPTIPGLEPPVRANPLLVAVDETIAQLRELGLVKPTDAGRVALARQLAKVLAIKEQSGRVSTYSNDARVLMELLEGFAAEASEGDAALRAAMDQWSTYVETGELPIDETAPSSGAS